ncbi:hypothetical protein PF005_g1601 [Phytophthora fragariae]|nr:hypothetical protein PF009_g1625 [Phytophthora fragariae]KAE8964708.1 hypothetical protein PR001_g28964 [Phytophthora rubi]KAE9029534.1 hypothetical protein PF011_g1012 [Phytophthora fragariae]KAE9040834.1 hypothetical protein PR002_g4762 [Phytophthora rubi]KAE9137636.1 hypothetical protein PF010_g1248 [Phytophthora fragariae]
MVLAVVIPVVVSVLVVALLFKFVPVLHEAFSSLRTRHEHEKTRERIDLEVGGVLMSPEPYHMTWPTPGSKPHSPFAETPKATGLRVIERPPRSPRVMTSLVSPIRTGCSPPKRAIRGEERLPRSPVVTPTVPPPVTAIRPFGRLV